MWRELTLGVLWKESKFWKNAPVIFTAILESFADSGDVINLRNQLAMDNSVTNYNNKILVFLNSDVDCNVRDQDEHQFTSDFIHNELQNQFTITFVYAKCKGHQRRTLWDKMH